MKNSTRKRLKNRKNRIECRLREIDWADQPRPMFSAKNIHFELPERTRGVAVGGIAAVHLLAHQSGLIRAIDERLHLLKRHLPYHESDHVLNIAYNVLCGGTALEDIELRRNNEVFLDMLGAQRIPDPTTAGDFCRRFTPMKIGDLLRSINVARVCVWKQQPRAFFEEATIDVDGTVVPTLGECKEGMEIAYNGQWGFHPLIVTLANTGEVLSIENRSGNRPSSEGAPERLDEAIELVRRGGFRKITLRGDTDFSQTRHLDRWDDEDVDFIFGYDAGQNLVKIAEGLDSSAWKRLKRKRRYEVATTPRRRPENFKEQIVKEREFKNIRLCSEEIGEFDYSPGACRKSYRMVVVKKNLSVERGENVLFDDVRYFFYITNKRRPSARQIVFLANGRCNQENLIAQLKGAVRALHSPVDNLVSNWAYMVMASLAWTLKAWFGLVLGETGRWKEKHRAQKDSVLRMEFKSFLNAFIRIPAQVVRTGRRIVVRLLEWNPWQEVFFRAVDSLHAKLQC